MPRIVNSIRVRVAWAMVLVLLALALPGTVRAGISFTFNFSIGGSCVNGNGPASSTIVVTLLDRDDQVIDTETVMSDGTGDWSLYECFWYNIHGSDKIMADSGSEQRTLQVPVITTTVNRVTDVVSGKAPTTGTFHLYSTLCNVYDCNNGPDTNVNVAPDGTYSKDFTSLTNLIGRDRVQGLWTSPQGDEVYGPNRTVPYMSVGIGDPILRGDAKPGSQVNANLRTSGGTLIGSGSDIVGRRATNIQLYFWTSNDLPAYPRPGHKVGSNVASDAMLTVPNITLTHDADSVSGHCFKNADVYVYLEHFDPSYDWTQGYTTSNSSGNFTLNIADSDNPSYVFGPADRWEVDCQNGKGDIVYRYLRFD